MRFFKIEDLPEAGSPIIKTLIYFLFKPSLLVIPPNNYKRIIFLRSDKPFIVGKRLSLSKS